MKFTAKFVLPVSLLVLLSTANSLDTLAKSGDMDHKTNKEVKPSVPDIQVCGVDSRYTFGKLPRNTISLYTELSITKRRSGVVALIRKVDQNKAILVPFPEGRKINQFTRKNLEDLWGESRRFTSSATVPFDKQMRTFDLWAIDGNEKDIYHIDAKFTDANLVSYRIRGTGISDIKWIAVN